MDGVRIDVEEETKKQKAARKAREWRAANPERVCETNKAWRAANPDRVREENRARYRDRPERTSELRKAKKYNLSVEQVRALNAVTHCQISGWALTPGRGRAIDHCHVTGTVRGVLHPRVNMALGLLGDNPELLRAMADYLERHRPCSAD